MDKVLYYAYAMDIVKNDPSSINTDDSPYQIGEIPVISELKNGTLQIEGSWCIGKDVSTGWMERSNLDTPIELNYGFAYYSLDKSKCHKFIQDMHENNWNYVDKVMSTMRKISSLMI